MRHAGCPFSARDWVIEIMSRASTVLNPTWIRIKGITSITLSYSGETEDNSGADSLWSEPTVTKRSATITLEGKTVADSVTGAMDAGQAELDYYLTVGGCDGDARLRLADPYGHAEIIDVVVTGREKSADASTGTVSWDASIVGEPIEEAYVQATAIAVTGTGITGTSATVQIGSTIDATVAFTPANASNQKYSVASADTTKVQIKNIDGLNFEIVPVAVTTSAVDVVVKSMNNNLTKTIAVTVTAAS